MRTVWKFPFALSEPTSLVQPGNTPLWRFHMPIEAKVLTVQPQRHLPTVWAEVDPDDVDTLPRWFTVVGTGHPLPDWEMSYVGTWQDGPFVWHLYLLDEGEQP